MIEAHDLLEKVGPRKFHEIVVNGQRGKTVKEMSRGIRGRVKYSFCGHGVETINNYEYTGNVCDKCNPEVRTTGRNFEAHFNVGLGAWVESKSEMNKLAKKKGMIHIGDEGINRL